MNRRNVARASWALSALLGVAAVVVLLWPESGAVSRNSASPKTSGRGRAAIPIPLSKDPVAPSPVILERLGSIRALEAEKDEAKLETLATSAPGDAADPRLAAQVRVGAVHALANIGTPSAFTRLRELLKDSGRELIVRLAAAHALARRGGDAEIAFLREQLAANPSQIVREKIRIVLELRNQ